ncbi:hypothetical protein AN958_01423 [Leucoagaricus sp. SymC.cos]|nr:hypothetical protein AN958_01423 [Leucoagaricus sp. SymC.cos]
MASRISIDNLPNEILSEIFQIYINHNVLLHDSMIPQYFCKDLCLVCSRWGRITLNTPQFWSTIKLSITPGVPDLPLRTLMTWVRQSGSLPVDIHIEIDNFQKTEYALGAFDVLWSSIRRWRTLTILAGHEAGQLLSQRSFQDASQLEHVEIDWLRADEGYLNLFIESLFSTAQPRFLSWKPVTPQLSQSIPALTSFSLLNRLDFCVSNSPGGLDCALDIIINCEMITWIHLKEWDSDPDEYEPPTQRDPNSICLLYLQILELELESAECIHILELLHCPSLHVLAITPSGFPVSTFGPPSVEVLAAKFANWTCAINSLKVLQVTGVSKEQILTFLCQEALLNIPVVGVCSFTDEQIWAILNEGQSGTVEMKERIKLVWNNRTMLIAGWADNRVSSELKEYFLEREMKRLHLDLLCRQPT